ncbi:MAG: ABC transporter permease [Acidimicrobiia bacterium]
MRFVLRQLAKLVITVFAVSLITFAMLFVLSKNGSTQGRNQIAVNIAGIGANDAQLAQVEKEYGLDKPVIVQYGKWMGKLLTGDLGVSYATNTKVSDAVKDRLPVSLWLMFWAQLIALTAAIALGTAAAYRANGPFDRAASTFAFGLLSLPHYVIGVVLQLFLAVKLGWFDAVSTYASPFDSPTRHIKAFFLPALTLALGQVAVYMRLLRADMVATLQNDYITMARAKGMSTRVVLFRHALRPSTFSMITAAGVNVGALIGGTVIVEQIFDLKGMGSLVVEAVLRRDLLVVQICVVIFAVAFVVVNFLVDMLYTVIDPRIRHARGLA